MSTAAWPDYAFTTHINSENPRAPKEEKVFVCKIEFSYKRMRIEYPPPLHHAIVLQAILNELGGGTLEPDRGWRQNDIQQITVGKIGDKQVRDLWDREPVKTVLDELKVLSEKESQLREAHYEAKMALDLKVMAYDHAMDNTRRSIVQAALGKAST